MAKTIRQTYAPVDLHGKDGNRHTWARYKNGGRVLYIKITQEMISAGAAVIQELYESLPAENLAAEVYRAMRAACLSAESTTHSHSRAGRRSPNGP